MNIIIEKTKNFTKKYSIDILIEYIKYKEDEYYFNIEYFNLLSENDKEECLELINLFFAIIIWARENNKTVDNVFTPISLGGEFNITDFERRYLFLKILALPFDMKKLLEEHYEALITISNSIYVNMPYRISNLSEFILSKRKEVSN